MKKGIVFFIVMLCLFATVDVFAQGCPMCKTALEEARSNGSQVGNTLNNGILYLLALPYLIVGAFAVIWYKNYRAKKSSATSY